MDSIGSRIRYLRQQKKASMKMMSEQIKRMSGIQVSTGQISDWENGNKNPSADGLLALSKYFDVSSDWLLEGDAIYEPKVRKEDRFADLTEEERRELELFAEFLRYKNQAQRNT